MAQSPAETGREKAFGLTTVGIVDFILSNIVDFDVKQLGILFKLCGPMTSSENCALKLTLRTLTSWNTIQIQSRRVDSYDSHD